MDKNEQQAILLRTRQALERIPVCGKSAAEALLVAFYGLDTLLTAAENSPALAAGENKDA